MTTNPGTAATDTPPRAAGRLQLPPEDDDYDHVGASVAKSLAGAGTEAKKAKERADRLTADYQIILELELVSYDLDTPQWRELCAVLAEYGYAVLRGWAMSGAIHRMARTAFGRGVYNWQLIPEDFRTLDPDEARELATSVLVEAIPAFREKTLMAKDPSKRWNPQGGASLTTFFIGRCLMELPGVVKEHLRQRPGRTGSKGGDDRPGTLRPVRDDTPRGDLPHVAGAARRDLEVVFEDTDEETRVMFRLQEQGHSIEEIAEMLGTTEPAVWSKMGRFRKDAAARGRR